MLIPVAKTMIAMTIVQSNSSNPSPVEVAARNHRWWFTVNLVWVVIAALVTAIMTYVVWRASNNEQDAQSSAANERARKLENDNLALRTDFNTEVGKVAALQTAASDALAAQQRVQTDLAKTQTELAEARERQATAEFKLEQLRKQQQPRWAQLHDSDFTNHLSGKAAGEAVIWYTPDDTEAYMFANTLTMLMPFSGWRASSPNVIPPTGAIPGVQRSGRQWFPGTPLEFRAGGNGQGLSVISQKLDAPPKRALVGALAKCGFFVHGAADDKLPPDRIVVIIGKKP